MKKIAKILSIILSATLLISTVVGCAGCKKEDDQSASVALPTNLDYSNSTKQFDYFGYHALHNGKYTVGGNTYDLGYDFVNEYYISEYFDSGIEIILAQSTAPMGSGNYESMEAREEAYNTSKLKKTLDIAHALGRDKSVVITDNNTYKPYLKAKELADAAKERNPENISLFGEWDGKTTLNLYTKENTYQFPFADEAALDKYIEDCMTYYWDHPAFGGMMIQDEPSGYMMRVIGEWYASVKRVLTKKGLGDLMINSNLLPYFANMPDQGSLIEVEEDFDTDKEQRGHEAYRRYLEAFLKYSGADTLQIDIYPLMSNGVYRMYILNLQVAAELARDYGAKLIIVNQTFGTTNERTVSYEDLQYVNNIVMGFGAENIGYYTYFTADDGGSYVFNDLGSMITRFGDKTDVYYTVQKLNEEGQKLAPVILNFDYKASKNYLISSDSTPLTSNAQHVYMAMRYKGASKFPDFTKLKDFSINKETAIVTELYDDERDNYMYMVFNSVDSAMRGSTVYQTSTLTFVDGYTHALVYYKGEPTVMKLSEGNQLTVKLAPGEARYVIPFTAA